ncbi:hypothetical protein MKW94_026977 [Papaver nudicaule]|uniref:Protein kinase domain-containing protein n=1 Tax=Papaver nudicaule TaxID=74823 RepID=A0AA41SQD8_PAPNU|nr:hypothetical protein [Papaver nudicaule]
MIGYNINDEGQTFLVYDFMPLRSLKHHLQDLLPNQKPLDWNTRMKIAAGAAKGLKYLHDESHPPLVHGNIKPSNILLCEGYDPKLSDILVFKERIPEPGESSQARYFGHQFHFTQQSDIYGLVLVLLELISGRMARPNEHSVTKWAKRRLVEGMDFTKVVDPFLKGHYPEQGLYQDLSLAAECLQHKEVSRPRIGYVANVLSNLASEIYEPTAIQINRVDTLAIGKIEKERLTEQWRHVWCFLY